MRCPNCGKIVSKDRINCIFCGTLLNDATKKTAKKYDTDDNISSFLEHKEKKKVMSKKPTYTEKYQSIDDFERRTKKSEYKTNTKSPKLKNNEFPEFNKKEEIKQEKTILSAFKNGNKTNQKPKKKPSFDDTISKKNNKDDDRAVVIDFKRFIPAVFILICILAGIVAGIIILVRQVNKEDTPVVDAPPVEAGDRIDIEAYTTTTGKEAHRINIYQETGLTATILEREVAFKDGLAVFEFTDEELYFELCHIYVPNFAVELDIVIQDSDREDPVIVQAQRFLIKQPVAKFELLQPSAIPAIAEEEFCMIVFNTVKGATITINDNDESDLLDITGRFEKRVKVIDGLMDYDISISAEGYADYETSINFELPITAYEFVLENPNPQQVTDGVVTIKGYTDVNATIVASIEDAVIDMDNTTGEFTITYDMTSDAYYPITLTITVPEKDTLVREIVAKQTIDYPHYTRIAWAFEYDDFLSSATRYDGQVFKVQGTITEIINTGSPNCFIIDLEESGNQPVYIEHYGEFDKNVGDSVTIFGDKWGQKDGIPRIFSVSVS